MPDPHTSCGPYKPVASSHYQPLTAGESEEMRMRKLMKYAPATNVPHDTVGIVALDVHGNVASGTTTNGATFKIPGFVTATFLSTCR